MTDLRRYCPRVSLLGRLKTAGVRRAGWGFFDQALSSVSNFALSAVVAATVSAVDFGSFTIAYAVYGVFAGISGGLASIPLVVRYSARDRPRSVPRHARPSAPRSSSA